MMSEKFGLDWQDKVDPVRASYMIAFVNSIAKRADKDAKKLKRKQGSMNYK